MNMPVLTCIHCGAKLKVKPATLRFIKEIPCAKCRKKFEITDEMKANAAAGVDAPATPAAPPPAPATPPAAPPAPAPAAPPAPTPTPAAVPAPAPVLTLVDAPDAVTTPAPMPIPPDATLAAKVDALDTRVKALEATIQSLRKALT